MQRELSASNVVVRFPAAENVQTKVPQYPVGRNTEHSFQGLTVRVSRPGHLSCNGLAAECSNTLSKLKGTPCTFNSITIIMVNNHTTLDANIALFKTILWGFLLVWRIFKKVAWLRFKTGVLNFTPVLDSRALKCHNFATVFTQF